MATDVIADHFLTNIEYKGGHLLTRISFIFSNGKRAPPLGTYDKKGSKQLAIPEMKNLDFVSFGLSFFEGNPML